MNRRLKTQLFHFARCAFAAACMIAVSANAQEKTVKKAADNADGDDKPLVSAPSLIGNIPIWQLKPFDRMELKNDERTKIDVEPERLPKNADFSNVEEGKYCGKPGLPWPGAPFRKDIWYRFTSSSEGRKYEVIGKGIAKIEHYEDIIFGALMGAGLRALGVPYAWSLGVVAGTLEVVPYIGGAITLVLAVLSAATVGLPHVVGVIVLYVVLVNVESHVLAPVLYGRVLGLPSVAILLALIAGVELLGIVGALLAIPLTIIAWAIAQAFAPEAE